ncbi:MAG: hypothetical protein M5R41_16205 [Bacteroidia bacterium]|nr:hypothetical protein [Bacteroidia bacterium]
MIHRYRTRILAISIALLFAQLTLAQSNYTFQSKNVAVIAEDNFSKGGSSDVWGIRIAGTPNRHYALSTLGGGLSIALVNGTSPAYYNEVAYVNDDDYYDPFNPVNIGVADVETFEVNNTTYAALAIANKNANPVVYIVNVDSAIALGQTAQDHFVPVSSVQTATIPNLDLGTAQAHTITIADNILYIATQTHDIDVWSLWNPTAPIHKG